MLEQLFGQRPAFAFLAHQLSHRHPHIVEEDLTETGLAADQLYGLDRDAGTLHVDQQKLMPSCFASLLVRTSAYIQSPLSPSEVQILPR
jgi:hypothetical protein